MDTRKVDPSLVSPLFVLDGKKPKPAKNVIEWTKWMRTADRRVACLKIEDIEVSTIFLGQGQDEGWYLLFESAISGGKYAGKRWVYSTWEQAEEGLERTSNDVVAN